MALLKNVLVLTILFGCRFSIVVNAKNIERDSISVSGKPAVDSKIFGTWSELKCKVSNDSKYSMSYTLDNSGEKLTTLIVKEIITGKVLMMSQISKKTPPEFTREGKQVVFIQHEDSLCVLNLSTGARRFTPHVSSFLLINNRNSQWIVYQSDFLDHIVHMVVPSSQQAEIFCDVRSFEVVSDQDAQWLICKSYAKKNQLHLFNLKTRRKREISDVENYSIGFEKKILLVTLVSHKLIWLSLFNEKEQTVCENMDIVSYCLDKANRQLALVVEQNDELSVLHFKEGTGFAVPVFITKQFLVEKPFEVRAIFNRDGTQLLISCYIHYAPKSVSGGGILKIWNYKDSLFPSADPVSKGYYFALDVHNKKINRLGTPGEENKSGNDFNLYLLMQNSSALDYYYNLAHTHKYHLTETATGKQRLLFTSNNNDQLSISPDEKYAIWFDADSLGWVSYQTSTGIKKNITKRIPYPMNDEYLQRIGRTQTYAYEVAGWSPEDNRVYLYDRYDLWEVDPSGKEESICITKGLGRKAKVTLGLVDVEPGYNKPTRIIHDGEKLVFSAYKPQTKETGFWTLIAGSIKNPVQGILQPYAFAVARLDRLEHNGKAPHSEITKIGNTDKYLVTRQSAEEFPNYFLTSDFNHYKQLTDFQPQKKYNWLTAELVNYPLPDGTTSQGILYKPENFNPLKKYPVIFEYYQGRSEEFHLFRMPDYTNGRINIPYFVSNGYLVFVPDIYLKKGENSQAVVDAVSSAARYLSKRHYVDSSKLGLQGHSHGGWETNVLVTNTQNLFAAACTADGMSDIISSYGQGTLDNRNNQEFYESTGQLSPYGVGVKPWTNLEVYVKDSPVFFVEKATAPLLIIHGYKDKAVLFSQGMEMYSALKRAGKKVWLLEYLDGGHTPDDIPANAKDMTIRMKQFFDYYLKGRPAPRWMTEEISDRVKETNDLELDTSNAKP